MTLTSTWQFWAVLAAIFAALTAIFAKIGVSETNPDFATFLRTAVVFAVLGVLLYATNRFESLGSVSKQAGLFLILSGLATGASWICYFRALSIGNASQVAPVDKLSVVLVAIFGTVFLGEQLSVANWIGVLLIGVGAGLIALV